MTSGNTAPLPSDRSFGLTFTAVFALLGAWMAYRSSPHFFVPLVASGLFLVATLAIPGALHPLNVAWMRLAAVLNRIVSPVVLGVIFFGMFAPIGWAMRLAGRDALKRRFEHEARSYWVGRTPPGPDPAGLPNQF